MKLLEVFLMNLNYLKRIEVFSTTFSLHVSKKYVEAAMSATTCTTNAIGYVYDITGAGAFAFCLRT